MINTGIFLFLACQIRLGHISVSMMTMALKWEVAINRFDQITQIEGKRKNGDIITKSCSKHILCVICVGGDYKANAYSYIFSYSV